MSFFFRSIIADYGRYGRNTAAGREEECIERDRGRESSQIQLDFSRWGCTVQILTQFEVSTKPSCAPLVCPERSVIRTSSNITRLLNIKDTVSRKTCIFKIKN